MQADFPKSASRNMLDKDCGSGLLETILSLLESVAIFMDALYG